MDAGYRHIVLIGMMGVGKTTVGRMLAKRLGWEFWDNDEALQDATETTAAELQRRRGQAALHAAENRLLQEALRSRTRTVFAAAGSVVLKPELLAGELTVWLRTSLAREQQNIARSGQHHRPLPEDAIAVLQRLSVARLPMYEHIADITVEVAAEPQATCDRVIAAVRKRSDHSS
jgi:shikimate kinase